MVLIVKNPPTNAGDIRDAGSVPGWGRSTGGGHGNPLQYSCLENPMVRGAWWATVHEGAKSQTRLKQFSTHIPSYSLYKTGASSSQREGRQTWLQCHRCSPSHGHMMSLWSFVLPGPSHPAALGLAHFQHGPGGHGGRAWPDSQN